jgi:hypothetical protein
LHVGVKHQINITHTAAFALLYLNFDATGMDEDLVASEEHEGHEGAIICWPVEDSSCNRHALWNADRLRFVSAAQEHEGRDGRSRKHSQFPTFFVVFVPSW